MTLPSRSSSILTGLVLTLLGCLDLGCRPALPPTALLVPAWSATGE